MSETPRVSILFPEQYEQAAIALGRAFVRDPALMAILPESVASEPAERVRRLTEVFRSVLGVQRREGEPVLGVLDEGVVAGAAVIAGAGGGSLLPMLTFGLPYMAKMISAVGWGGTKRALELTGILARNHPPERHIYLNFLGVDPVHQRKHYGAALLDALRDIVVQRMDLAGVYLETATEANVPYYSSRGYSVLSDVYPLGVRFWRMFQPRNAIV